MIINNISFKAGTTIVDDTKTLSKRQIRTLTKAGEKIGTDKDSIKFRVSKSDDMLVFSHNANLNSLNNPIDTSSIVFKNKDEINAFDYISEKLKKIKKLYNLNKRKMC